MTYQKVAGSLCAKMCAGYCGQDAYSDMLITDNGILERNTDGIHSHEKQCGGGSKDAG